MISIKNTQKKIPFNVPLYKKKAQHILDFLKYTDFDLGIWLTTDTTIHKYNKTYRNKDKPTDVLSFPYHTELKAGHTIKVHTPEDKNLGDLIISMPYVYENRHNLDGDFTARMDRMLVHGICHLLGYDHIDDTDFKKMQKLENKIQASLQLHFKNS